MSYLMYINNFAKSNHNSRKPAASEYYRGFQGKTNECEGDSCGRIRAAGKERNYSQTW